MKYVLFALIYFTICACQRPQLKTKTSPQIQITDLLKEDGLSIRAIAIDSLGQRLYFSANNNQIGFVDLDNNTVVKQNILPTEEGVMEFRALALSDRVYVLSAGNPALLYSLDYDLQNARLEYREQGDKVFYDALSFDSFHNGLALGDEQMGCMAILQKKKGEDWKKLPCSQLPKEENGTGAFAASNTNIKQIGQNIWMTTNHRILLSHDGGAHWTSSATPITQSQPSSGIYSIDFYNSTLGVAIGGDYTHPEANTNNFIRSFDGGRSWTALNGVNAPGYRSCIQFIPKTEGKGLITVGFKGIDISYDGGQHWTHVSDTSWYTIRCVNQNTAYVAGKGRIARLKIIKK